MTEYSVYAPSAVRKIRRDRTPSSHTIDVQSVTDGVSRRVKIGCTSLIFIDPSVNSLYYRNVLLSYTTVAAGHTSDLGRVLHYFSRTVHRQTGRLRRSTFLNADLWPPNRPDLNPVDYAIWGIMQQRVYQTKVLVRKDVDDLKQRLVDVWAGMQQTVIDEAIDQWRKRLHACIRARERHF